MTTPATAAPKESFFQKLEGAEHTFAAWAEKELAKIQGAAPTLEAIADTTLTYLGPILQTIVSAEAGTKAGGEVSSVIQQAQQDLTAVRGVIQDAGASPSVTSVLGAVSSNLSGLLTAGHVTSTKSVGLVNKVLGEINTLAGAVTATPAPPPPPPADPQEPAANAVAAVEESQK